MAVERRMFDRGHDGPELVSTENDMIALGSGSKDIRREAQQLVNIVEVINAGEHRDDAQMREVIQERLDAIAMTIRSLQRRFNPTNPNNR